MLCKFNIQSLQGNHVTMTISLSIEVTVTIGYIIGTRGMNKQAKYTGHVRRPPMN